MDNVKEDLSVFSTAEQPAKKKTKYGSTAEPKVKVIKSAGNGGVSRISQACDRCRIKKIKCDGKLPSCSNCLHVGFQCKTSDKLSRRAFPRGYTENLEKNLVNLQNENAQLLMELEAMKSGKKPEQEVQDSVGRLQSDHTQYTNYTLKDRYIGLCVMDQLYNGIRMQCGLPAVSTPVVKSYVVPTSIDEFITLHFLEKLPQKNYIDMLISNAFENILSLVPVLDETVFYHMYNQLMSLVEDKAENLSLLIGQVSKCNAISTNITHIVNGVTEKTTLEANRTFILQLVLLIQLQTGLFPHLDMLKLFHNVNLTSQPDLNRLQTCLLATWYFSEDPIGLDLLSTCNSMVLQLGLFLNGSNFVDTLGSQSSDFKVYSNRLKVYWSFYLIETTTYMLQGLPIKHLFASFEMPKLRTILNSNKNLQGCCILLEHLQSLENTNLLNCSVDHILNDLKKELKNVGLFHECPDITEDQPRRNSIKERTPGMFLEIQLTLYYQMLKFMCHIKLLTDQNNLLLVSSKSQEILSLLFAIYEGESRFVLKFFTQNRVPFTVQPCQYRHAVPGCNITKLMEMCMLTMTLLVDGYDKSKRLFNIQQTLLKIWINSLPETEVTKYTCSKFDILVEQRKSTSELDANETIFAPISQYQTFVGKSFMNDIVNDDEMGYEEDEEDESDHLELSFTHRAKKRHHRDHMILDKGPSESMNDILQWSHHTPPAIVPSPNNESIGGLLKDIGYQNSFIKTIFGSRKSSGIFNAGNNNLAPPVPQPGKTGVTTDKILGERASLFGNYTR